MTSNQDFMDYILKHVFVIFKLFLLEGCPLFLCSITPQFYPSRQVDIY